MKTYKTIQILFLILTVILLTQQVFALVTIDIDIQPQFGVGEKISLNYTFESSKAEQVNYVVSVNCPNAPQSLLEIRTAQFDKDVPFEEKYVYLEITDDIEPQTCTAYVEIISPIEQTVSKNFIIVTDPSFSFSIELDKKVFVQKEEIHLDYNSDVDSPSMLATLIYPDGTIKQINLPTLIKAEQIGTYTLDLTASKEGYKTISKKEQFAVIEKHAEIEEADFPDTPVADLSEDYDLPEEDDSEKGMVSFYKEIIQNFLEKIIGFFKALFE